MFISSFKSFISGLIICGLLFPQMVSAVVIELQTKDGLVMTANYHQGDAEKPSILILHGFLQTRDSHTVATLYDSLVASGYTVLAPNLSLGVNHRNQSLACEAIHLHSMESDIAEIDIWSRWLNKKSSSKVTLIGHSVGSVHQLAYLSQYKNSHIKQAILISLSYFGISPAANETIEDGNRATTALETGNQNPDEYGLTYCKKYVTTPAHYLSYYNWQPDKLLTTMKSIPTPLTVIIGSKDQRITQFWVTSMKKNDIHIISIPGAGHFFSNEYEFDLQDSIENLLSNN